jgi:tetratricopeptide (TPR) repeat protein
VADFLGSIGDAAQVAVGRALPYGDGITYWPLAELLIQLGLEPSTVIHSSPADTQLATRAMLERRAAERPVVLVLDDVHWAEAPMLDLVEHVVDWSRGFPIMLVCLARPELLDVRPTWGGGKLNATSILLEPLPETEADRLADGLLAGIDLDDATRGRIVQGAAGNPLFLEEMAALAHEAPSTVDVPPTIQALLQARLDTLSDGERAVIERGAVEGEVFHRGAVTALAPAAPALDVPAGLFSLVRKELVRPDRALIVGDEAFRFRHLLIRDAAYEGLPKAARATLHEQFADWLEARSELLERDEIVGYHLEQAVLYRAELGADDAAAVALRRRAAQHLGSAGHAAIERSDYHAAKSLLRRALAHVDDASDRRELIPGLIDALIEERDSSHATEIAELLDELAAGDAHAGALATVLATRNDPTGRLDELTARLDRAERALAAAADSVGLARCECARGWVYWGACRSTAAHDAFLRAHTHLRDAGSAWLARDVMLGTGLTATFSALPAAAFLALLDRLDESAAEGGPLLRATLGSLRARVEYAAGNSGEDELRAALSVERELARQAGAGLVGMTIDVYEFIVVPWLASDAAGVVSGARRRVETTSVVGTRLFHANALAMLAIALCGVGEHEEARAAVEDGRSIVDPHDVADQLGLELAEAYARALAGDHDRARECLARARTLNEGIDVRPLIDDADWVTARILAQLGDVEGARRLLELLEQREVRLGYRRYVDRYRRDLAALDAVARD